MGKCGSRGGRWGQKNGVSKADRGGESQGRGVPNTPGVARGGRRRVCGDIGKYWGNTSRKINDGSLSIEMG